MTCDASRVRFSSIQPHSARAFAAVVALVAEISTSERAQAGAAMVFVAAMARDCFRLAIRRRAAAHAGARTIHEAERQGSGGAAATAPSPLTRAPHGIVCAHARTGARLKQIGR